MGVSIIDQKPLYSAFNENIGTIHSVPVYAELPSDAFAIYDKRSKPTLVDGQSYYTWEDMSSNGRDMTLYQMSENSWDGDHIVCADGGFISGELETNSFTPSEGVALNFLVSYKYDIPDYPSGTAGAKGVDCLCSLKTGSNERQQFVIGARLDNDKKLGVATNLNDGTGFTTCYTSDSYPALTSVHLITFVLEGSPAKGKMYIDGILLSGFNVDGTEVSTDYFTPAKTMNGTLPNLYFFAPNVIGQISSSNYNFFGNVYAVSVYNRVLADIEVGQCVDFYKQRYRGYTPTLNIL